MPKLIDIDVLRYDLCACLCGAYEQCQEWCHTLAVINMQPIIDAKPERHGRWIESPNSCQINFECSECGALGTVNTPYCAYCGSRMDGGAEQ